MFLSLLSYEYKYLLKRLSTYIYALVFFSLGFLLMNAFAGAFTGIRVQTMNSGAEQSFTNSSINIMMISSGLNLLLILFIGGYLSDILLKDFSHNSFQLVYTKQISKVKLLLARLFVGITTVIGIFFFLQLGLMLAQFSPWLNAKQFQPFNILLYLNPFLKVSITNVIIASSFYTLVAVLSKKKLYVNMSAVLMYLVYTGVMAFNSKLELKEISALFDMFGLSTLGIMTENWTIAQRNTELLSFSSYFLYNRLLWLGVGLFIYLISFKLYKFNYPLNRKKSKDNTSKAEVDSPKYIHYGLISQNWNFFTYLKQFHHYFKIEFKILTRSIIFRVFSVVFILFVFSSLSNYSVIYDTAVHPVTYIITENLKGIVLAFAVLYIAIFSSELVWKSRSSNSYYFEDCAPMSDNIKAISHVTTLTLSIAIMWGIGSLIGIGYQLFFHFYQIDFSLYLIYGGLLLLPVIMYSAVAVLIQNLMPNRMAGIFFFFGFFTLIEYLPYLGLEHPLWQMFNIPSVTYSDMNGFGSFLAKYFTHVTYWLSFSLILLILGIRLYRRGNDLGLKHRWKKIYQAWTLSQVISLVILAFIFIGAGSYIFHNTNILNSYYSQEERRQASVKFEREYKYLEKLPGARVTDVDLDVQIYPDLLDLKVGGDLILMNKSDSPIDSILFFTNQSEDNFSYQLDREFDLLKYDEDYNLYLLRLKDPLKPQETFKFSFQDYYEHKGYEVDTNICENGSFFNSSIFMPVFAYADYYELSSNEIRKKYQLPPKERMAESNDLEARGNTYISKDSDWVNFSATIGTSADQIAVAPGYLVDSWEENGRKNYRYEMDHPILKFFSFSSARYEIAKDKWVSNSGKEVNLEIYYHPGHDYNLKSMMKALKMGLTYYSDNFMEYPHKQMRILEFPRYATFAQSFPNTVPYSEGIGFIARLDGKENQDYPFFVTAHELAHQWWAHVVIGADVKGAVLMSEALAQYSALSVMEEEYGEVKMGEFLKHELHSYVTGRSSESSKEMPLSQVENQQYIHYNKGSVVMYGLKKYIGEEAVNTALKSVVDKYGYQNPPYINSEEFLTEIYQVVPDSLKYLAKEMFEDIILYSNNVNSVEVTKENDLYRVDMELECYKIKADSIGNEEEIPLDDWIEVLAFSREYVDGKATKLVANPDNRWFKLKSGKNNITFYTETEPVEAGVDPLYKLLDKNVFDNVKAVKSIKENI
jgi:hypothetical protein